jgi:branched-chain amino acid transport system substrate-binding protein
VKIAIPILNRAGVAMMSYSATWPGLTKPDKGNLGEPDVYYPTGTRNFARTTPADDIQGFVGANWAKELGVKRAYILHGDSVYGKGLAEIFRTQVKKLGIDVVGDEVIDVEAKDYRELAKMIKVAAPDLVYFGGLLEDHPDLVLHDLQAAGFGGKFMGGDGIYDDALITEAGEAAEGVYVTFGGVPPEQLTGKGKQWFDAYVEKFKAQPESSTSLAYETAGVALAAINKACEKDRAAIREALFATKAYDGLFGSWSFNENGDTSLTTMSGLQVKHGAFEFVKLLTSQ